MNEFIITKIFQIKINRLFSHFVTKIHASVKAFYETNDNLKFIVPEFYNIISYRDYVKL